MAFQTTVNLVSGAGVPGDFYSDSPRICESFILNSVSALNNVFGRAFTKIAGADNQGQAQVGNPTTTGVFAGFLVNPKGSVNYGILGNALAPTLVLPNESQAELLTMGTIFVTLPAAAAIGDYVYFDNTTGALTTQAPGSAPLSGTSFAFAEVDFFAVAAAGLAVITVKQYPAVPSI
jgi:structural protein gp24